MPSCFCGYSNCTTINKSPWNYILGIKKKNSTFMYPWSSKKICIFVCSNTSGQVTDHVVKQKLEVTIHLPPSHSPLTACKTWIYYAFEAEKCVSSFYNGKFSHLFFGKLLYFQIRFTSLCKQGFFALRLTQFNWIQT